MYHTFESLQEMHVEVTSRCNAACPMCARNNFGGSEKDGLVLSDWSAQDAEKVFDVRFKNLRNVLLCGTHGDPAVNPNSLEIVQTIRKNAPNATVEFYSNGSLRTPQWWSELGRVLRKKNEDGYYRRTDLCIFSVDGLGDTNHLYRRKTNFEKIMANAEAFIKSGGIARWDYIVFKHNEHQVEEAEALAKKMGFKQFRIRKTSRFAYSPDGPMKHRVLNSNNEIEYFLEPTSRSEFLNKEKETYEKIVSKEKQETYSYESQVKCLNKTQFQRIYINAQVKVMPCCFVGNDFYPGSGLVFRDTKAKVGLKYGEEFNSLKEKTWDEILNHDWYAKDLVASWNQADTRLVRCQRTCGAQCNPITSQSQDVQFA